MSDTITEVIADLRLAHLSLGGRENQGDAARLVRQSISDLNRIHSNLETAQTNFRKRTRVSGMSVATLDRARTEAQNAFFDADKAMRKAGEKNDLKELPRLTDVRAAALKALEKATAALAEAATHEEETRDPVKEAGDADKVVRAAFKAWVAAADALSQGITPARYDAFVEARDTVYQAMADPFRYRDDVRANLDAAAMVRVEVTRISGAHALPGARPGIEFDGTTDRRKWRSLGHVIRDLEKVAWKK